MTNREEIIEIKSPNGLTSFKRSFAGVLNTRENKMDIRVEWYDMILDEDEIIETFKGSWRK